MVGKHRRGARRGTHRQVTRRHLADGTLDATLPSGRSTPPAAGKLNTRLITPENSTGRRRCQVCQHRGAAESSLRTRCQETRRCGNRSPSLSLYSPPSEARSRASRCLEAQHQPGKLAAEKPTSPPLGTRHRTLLDSREARPRVARCKLTTGKLASLTTGKLDKKLVAHSGLNATLLSAQCELNGGKLGKNSPGNATPSPRAGGSTRSLLRRRSCLDARRAACGGEPERGPCRNPRLRGREARHCLPSWRRAQRNLTAGKFKGSSRRREPRRPSAATMPRLALAPSPPVRLYGGRRRKAGPQPVAEYFDARPLWRLDAYRRKPFHLVACYWKLALPLK